MIHKKDIRFTYNSETKLTYVIFGKLVIAYFKKFIVGNNRKPFTLTYCTMNEDDLPMDVNFHFKNRGQVIDHIVEKLDGDRSQISEKEVGSLKVIYSLCSCNDTHVFRNKWEPSFNKDTELGSHVSIDSRAGKIILYAHAFPVGTKLSIQEPCKGSNIKDNVGNKSK